MIEYIIISLLLSITSAGTIVSNVPIIVSPTKNYTSAAPQWVTSPYFRAGYEQVIKVLTGNDKTPTYTFTFSSALPGLPNLAYGIKNYRGNDYFGQQFYQIKKIGLTAATFTVSIQIYGVTNLWVLTVAYLAADPTFPHHLNTFDNVPINNTGGDIVNITNYQSELAYYTNYVNYSQQAQGLKFTKFTTPYSSNNIVLFITSFWVRASFGSSPNFYPVQFHVYTGVVNQSYYYWNITLRVQCLVTNVHFSEIIFNTDDVQSSNQYFIVYQKWYNDLNGGFIEVPQEFIDNFIMGITSFQTVDGRCGFQYQWEFTTQTVNGISTFGVQLLLSWTLTNTCGFSWSQSSIFYMKTWICPDPFNYFNLTSNLCQTQCGGYFYENTTVYLCVPCTNTLCYQCDNPNKNLCTDCASYLFYQLVNGSCVCMSGYFASQSACIPCKNPNAGCMTCSYNDGSNGTLSYNSSKFQCITCNNTANYFLSGKLCAPCTLSNCVTCQNLTACSTCTSTYNLSVILTCVKCFVTGCTYCSATNSNQCAVCSNGYYLSNTLSCYTKCGDGIYVPAAEQCDDGNNATYDGCSSTCTIESSFTCSGSPSSCNFASSITLSLVNTIIQTTICDTITFTFKILPSSATFSQPYIVWNNFIVTPNSSLIRLNTSMFNYISGNLSVSYFMLATIQNQSLTFSTDFTTLIPNSTIFESSHSNSLTFNVNPTNNKQALLQCCIGYYYSPAIRDCSQICGDGLLFNLSCDDGNTNSGDGCSSICQIESSYVCSNGSSNSSSICCYNGSVSVSISSAIKDPSSNSLTISYNISPIQPVLSLINNSYNLAPYITLSNPSATITSAVYDPSTGLVNVQVSYNETIQGQPLNLQFTPPNVPQAALLPNIAQNWVVNPTNHLSASFYSESTYDQVKKLAPYATTCLALYLALNFITLFFRKFIGLEMATLMQISYLSLLSNSQLPAQLQIVSSWSYVFGYNNYIPSRNLQAIDSPYALYGYQQNFGYSCNAMALAIICVYGLSILLMALSAVTSLSVARRLKAAGLLLLNQIGFALVIFSTPNIITAFCIEIKEGSIFNTSLFWSTSFLVLSIVAIIVGNIINLANIQEGKDVGTFFRKHSQLGVYCSVFFSLRLICLTVFLFLYHMIGASSMYIVLFVQFLYVIFIIFGRPHKKKFDFIRSLIIEISLLYILLVRYIQVSLLNSTLDKSSNVFKILSMVQLATYGLCIVLSIASLIYHLVKRVSKNTIHPEEDRGGEVKIENQSIAKMQFSKQFFSKQLVPSMSPTKRKMDDSNGLVFDIQQLDNTTHSPPFGSTGQSEIKLDIKRQQRKYRRRR